MASGDANPQGAVKGLQAMLSSLGEDGAPSGKLTAEQIQKLSERLTELGVVEGVSQARNEGSEHSNEEGLPIVDITEPVDSSNPTYGTDPSITHDPDLIPLGSLPPAERARLRDERERFFDALEEEECIAQAKEEEEERQSRREELEKRKEAMKHDIERLKAARDLQKRMGKALLKNMAETREKEEEARKIMDQRDLDMEAQRKVVKPKKSVSFAGLPPESEEEQSKSRAKIRELEIKLDKKVDGHAAGDVALGRLRSSKDRNMPTLVDQGVKPQTMKMTVVERHPSKTAQADDPFRGDSDDDSSHDDTDLDKSEDDTNSQDEEPVLDEIYDLDTAQHQREIALEYYEKRANIGREVAEAMASQPLDEDWNQPEVPLEATLVGGPPKPSVSRFKADRTASRTPTASTPVSSTLPASAANTLRRSIKTGKLVNGQLVDSDTSDEGDEHVKQFMDALKKGEVQNIGPQGNSSAAKSPFPTLAVNPTSPRSHSPVETPVNEMSRSSPKLPSASALAKDENHLLHATSSPLIISSPSFPPPSDTSRKAPTVMASAVTVTEHSTNLRGQTSDAAGRKKISRFMADRTE